MQGYEVYYVILMENVNYQKITDEIIKSVSESKVHPRLLLHACCAPCSSYCIEYLSGIFDITVFYYNPNITEPEEYEKRCEEIKRFVAEAPFAKDTKLEFGPYEPEKFKELAKGHEKDPERGERCRLCYRMRLEKTAEYAGVNKFDYFTTTLSISPLKDAKALNAIGKELAEKYKVSYLYSDFKKKNGYKRSIELSDEYSLYRQNFCGCEYSKRG